MAPPFWSAASASAASPNTSSTPCAAKAPKISPSPATTPALTAPASGCSCKIARSKKMISTYVGENKLFEQLVFSGEVQVELNPQGTFSERIRAGGAGIPAFFTPTGYGTMVAEGKETREFDGRHYVLERALRGDFAFIKAWKGDRWGNLIYRKTSRNFNPMMATAADYVIAEVEQLVELGQLAPDQIHTPGIFVDAIFQGPHYEKKIERRTVRKS